jgi:hypothetical protein
MPGYLRDHISPVFKRITKEPTAHLYTMRHTYETYLYDRTRDIEMVADYLGHKHLDNVNVYVHICQAIRTQTRGKRSDLFHQALRQSHNGDGGKFDRKRDCCKKPYQSPQFSPVEKYGPVRI